MKHLRWFVAGSILIVAASATIGAPRHRKALKMLNLLKQVDGAGSGLDADTVRGLVPLVAVDAAGRVAGTYLRPNVDSLTDVKVVRRLGDQIVMIDVGHDGFVEKSSYFYYESTDCSGPRLMIPSPDSAESPSFFPPITNVIGHTAYYPTQPTARLVRSGTVNHATQNSCVNDATPSNVFIPPDTCCMSFPIGYTFYVGEATGFDLDTLGLTPPFRLDVPGPTGSS